MRIIRVSVPLERLGSGVQSCKSVSEDSEAVSLTSTRYQIRVMRPTFQRAILTVEAGSEQAAAQAALEQAGRLSDNEWARLDAEIEPPVIEIAVSEEELGSPADEIVAFLNDVQHAYALFRADLAEGAGTFIVPTWLRSHPALTIADITQDWNDALSGIYAAGIEEFIGWLGRQTRPANVEDFFSERDKRRAPCRESSRRSVP